MPALPGLRRRYLTFERSAPRDVDAAGLLAELDELVDASNSLASVVGLEAADTTGDARDHVIGAVRASP
jgi:hypothetical protein